jgi:peptide deformylase
MGFWLLFLKVTRFLLNQQPLPYEGKIFINISDILFAMDRTNIITLPHSSLRTKSIKAKPHDPATRQLAEDMMAATLDWEDHRKHEFGVALAAVQVNHLQRLVVIRNNFDDKNDRSFIVLVNPQIIRAEGQIIEEHEGCLSVLDVYGLVPRFERVKVKATDLEGKDIRLKADGFLARVLQHEIDHTEGKLFIDHIKGKDVFYKIAEDGKLEKTPLEDVMNNPDLWP